MRFFWLLCAFWGALGAFDISNLNVATSGVSGRFVERVELAGLDMNATSKGRFELKEGALFWRVETPVKTTLKICKEGIFEEISGAWVKKDALMDKDIFLAITNLDETRLSRDFNLNLSGGEAKWSLSLTPKTIIFKEIFDEIIVEGGETVQKIIIKAANGDVTTDEFLEVKY